MSIRSSFKEWARSKISLYVAQRHFQGLDDLLFDTIELELRTKCNGVCPFCAASALLDKRQDISMPTTLFEKVMNELSELDYKGRVSFYVNTEPFLDSRLLSFVKYARERCPNAYLHVMTNGKLLNKENGLELLYAGLDLLEINHYSDDNKLRRNIEGFLLQSRDRFNDKIRLNMRQLTQQLNNRAGSSPNGADLKHALKAFCQRPFQKIIVSAEGKVGICEHDFYFDHSVGSVLERSIRDVWFSEEFKKIRTDLVAGKREDIPLCSKCNYAGYGRVTNPFEKYHGSLYAQSRNFSDNVMNIVSRLISKF